MPRPLMPTAVAESLLKAIPVGFHSAPVLRAIKKHTQTIELGDTANKIAFEAQLGEHADKCFLIIGRYANDTVQRDWVIWQISRKQALGEAEAICDLEYGFLTADEIKGEIRSLK